MTSEYWSAEAFTVTSEMCCLLSGGTWTLLKRLILRSDIDKRQMLPNLFKHSPKFCSLFSCNKLWSSNKSQVTIFSLSETSENSENSQISRQAAVKELELVLIWNMETNSIFKNILFSYILLSLCCHHKHFIWSSFLVYYIL